MSEQANSSIDTQEVVPGFIHEKLEGTIWQTASDEDLRVGLEKAFDYRGDVTITTTAGTTIEGYIFDRRAGSSLKNSIVRLLPKDDSAKVEVSYDEIAGLRFTGRDTAAGKSWEAWVKKYWEKKAAGEKDIQIQPEKLD